MGVGGDDHNSALQAFLDACRPVTGAALAYLAGRGVDADVAAAMNVRLCGEELGDIYVRLSGRLGEESLEAAGIVGWCRGRRRLAFLPYLRTGAEMLVFPYRRDGVLVHLQARPALDRSILRAHGLPGALGTGDAAPTLFNVDALADSDRVAVCRGEIDALTAESYGYRAVGLPATVPFQPDWVRPLTDKQEVFLLMDDRELREPRLIRVKELLDQLGGPTARIVELPPDQSLARFLDKARQARWRWNLFREVARTRKRSRAGGEGRQAGGEGRQAGGDGRQAGGAGRQAGGEGRQAGGESCQRQ